jgi:hypothetical protein
MAARLHRLNARLARVEQAIQHQHNHASHEQAAEQFIRTWPHAQWTARLPDGTWETVRWEEWMGPWPVVISLINTIEDAAHAAPTRHTRPRP